MGGAALRRTGKDIEIDGVTYRAFGCRRGPDQALIYDVTNLDTLQTIGGIIRRNGRHFRILPDGDKRWASLEQAVEVLVRHASRS